MKRVILLAICAIALASCDGGGTEIAMEYQLTAEVNPTNMVKDMKGGNNSDFFTSDEDLYLTLYSYIYDDNGDLLEEKSVVLDNFYDTATFKSSLMEGTYTAVYVVCINDSDGYPIWNANNESSLYNLTFSVRDGWREWAHVLGVKKQTFNIQSSKEIDVEIESVGEFVAMLFTYGNDSQAAYLYVTGDKRSISYSVNDEKSNIYTATDGYVAWSDEDTLSQDYAGVAICYFFLPIDNMNIAWRSYDSSLNVINSGSFYYTLTPGNCSTVTTNIDSGVTTKSVGLDDFSECNYKVVKQMMISE